MCVVVELPGGVELCTVGALLGILGTGIGVSSMHVDGDGDLRDRIGECLCCIDVERVLVTAGWRYTADHDAGRYRVLADTDPGPLQLWIQGSVRAVVGGVVTLEVASATGFCLLEVGSDDVVTDADWVAGLVTVRAADDFTPRGTGDEFAVVVRRAGGGTHETRVRPEHLVTLDTALIAELTRVGGSSDAARAAAVAAAVRVAAERHAADLRARRLLHRGGGPGELL